MTNASSTLINWFLNHPRRLIGASVLRLAVGMSGILFYLGNLGVRDYLWGPHSYSSFSDFLRNLHEQHLSSLYSLSRSEGWFQALYLVGLIVAVAFTLRGGRLLAVAHCVLILSLYNRNPFILDGGDNFATLAAIFLPLLITDRYLALGAARRRTNQRDERWFSTVAHNAAAVIVVAETCAVYTVAGFWKVGSVNWRNGDALYYISRATEFHFSALMAAAMRNAFLVAAATYFIVIVQIAFAPAVLSRRYAPLAVAGVALMHLGIITTMGLVTFGVTMLGADSVCLGDAHYQRLAALVGPFVRSVVGRRHPTAAIAATPGGEP